MKSNDPGQNFLHPRTIAVATFILVAAMLRLAPHPMNFTPIGALALFGGAYVSSKRTALAIPLLSLIVGDAVTGFHPLIPFVYASFLVSVLIGFRLRQNRSASRIGAATLAGAIQFFIVTNLAVWTASIGPYPKTVAGLAACYVRGIPLFWNTLAGDAFYAALFFGGMALAERRFPSLRDPALAARFELEGNWNSTT
jgi:hypothetical protein